ncbi:Small heat shock protein C2 isoform A [Senna tora]|uniref:Small heat shock protein C2 isoform A n=1 Tax=Senna tora TaxID=362788 RepID=A0A835CAU7_9FABA|nr:Small heat shock protein C2 isoform A [Senna tora]
MESEAVRRRVHIIAAHFSSKDDISPNHLLPMNCSGSLNSVLRRCDNKLSFARQASSSLGPFMRQASVDEQGSVIYSATPKSCGFSSETPSKAREREPCFARLSRTKSDLSNVSVAQPMVQGYDVIAPDPPSFSRPSRRVRRGDQLHSEKKIHQSEVGGIEWSPRMDVAESEGKYVMTVEVPGVSISDIRVEVDDQKLSIKGRRSSSFWRVENCPNASFSSYHKREILYGPYEVVWAFPAGVNKDSISAEFLDGFLQIVIPKL